MNTTELQILKSNIQGQLTNKTIAPICISGSPGIGKSTNVALLAKELDMNVIDISGSSVTIEFLSGLPNEVDLPEFEQYSLTLANPIGTKWSMPELLVLANTAAQKKDTILLLDDFHLANQSVQPYFFKLLLQRQLGDFKLADNVAIVMTINNSESAGMNGFNSALRNRLSILEIEFNFDTWFKNHGNRLNYLVASFLKAKPHYTSESETTTIQGYATARAWTAIAAELDNHTPEFIHTNSGRIAGMQVSPEAAKAFQTHVMYVANIDFTNLVKSKTIVDLATKDPLDTIIYSYITNFIITPEDGKYLFELMEANNNEASSQFIGFVLGELYIKFTHSTQDKPISDGIRYIIDTLLGQQINPDNYIKPKSLDKVAKFKPANLQQFMKLAHEYLL